MEYFKKDHPMHKNDKVQTGFILITAFILFVTVFLSHLMDWGVL